MNVETNNLIIRINLKIVFIFYLIIHTKNLFQITDTITFKVGENRKATTCLFTFNQNQNRTWTDGTVTRTTL